MDRLLTNVLMQSKTQTALSRILNLAQQVYFLRWQSLYHTVDIDMEVGKCDQDY